MYLLSERSKFYGTKGQILIYIWCLSTPDFLISILFCATRALPHDLLAVSHSLTKSLSSVKGNFFLFCLISVSQHYKTVFLNTTQLKGNQEN
jgi:hypothetical protein